MRGMTSYARAQRKKGALYLEVTLRSLNSRYLEIYTHQLPPEKMFLEEVIKREIRNRINRGRIEVYFCIRNWPSPELKVNKDIVRKYYSQAKKLSRELHIPKDVFFKDIMSLPGVIHIEERSAIDDKLILSTVKEAINKLVSFKEKEGKLIQKEISKNLSAIKEKVKRIRKHTTKKVINGNSKDTEEELSLILFYTDKLSKLIHSNASIVKGKTLDFLTQEILRELNAAASKTKGKQVSWWLLEGKTFIERIREQAQNVE